MLLQLTVLEHEERTVTKEAQIHRRKLPVESYRGGVEIGDTKGIRFLLNSLVE